MAEEHTEVTLNSVGQVEVRFEDSGEKASVQKLTVPQARLLRAQLDAVIASSGNSLD